MFKVLVSAYACEPNRGSEPEVGWQWAQLLSNRVNLTVITRSSNKRDIEQAIQTYPTEAGIRNVQFIYYDLPPLILALKRGKILSNSIYYLIWQFIVGLKFSRIGDKHDIVHHITFCSILCPGFWRLKKAKFVVGPVGAPIVPQHFLPLFGWRAPIQRLRNKIIKNFKTIPWLANSYKNSRSIIPANSDTKKLFADAGFQTEEVILDTGHSSENGISNSRIEKKYSASIKFVYAGQIERRKGVEILIRAFSKIPPELSDRYKFDIYGRGPDLERIRSLINTLGLNNNISLCGYVPRKILLDTFSSYDAFLFSSIRDTSAGVNIEAMSAGLPLICLCHQGVSDISTAQCALRIEPTNIENTTRDFASAIEKFMTDEALRIALGSHAAERINRHFLWSQKGDAIMKIYSTAIESNA